MCVKKPIFAFNKSQFLLSTAKITNHSNVQKTTISIFYSELLHQAINLIIQLPIGH